MAKTLLDEIFNQKAVPPQREKRRPSNMFNLSLADWETRRGHELHDGAHGLYCYYAPDLRSKMKATDGIFECAEEVRTAARDTDNDEWLFDWRNEAPGLWIEQHAKWFGWRLVPLAKKTSVEMKMPQFAYTVENRTRSWLAKADAVWEIIETLPDNRKNRESFESYIRPLRIEARQIAHGVTQWLEMNYDMSLHH